MSTTDKTSASKPAGVPLPSRKRGGIKGFFRDVIAEMKKVIWPTPRETTRLTGVVLGVCALVVILLTLSSLAVEALLKVIIPK
ncbi:MAG: preprotein translocase subunit SecE [Fimbriimonadaceae bacterium]|jgi:preprotein translocase subunit SecE|nr:preprotein translocase subunit SecE [Fimbriimonadaceae bacterium]